MVIPFVEGKRSRNVNVQILTGEKIRTMEERINFKRKRTNKKSNK
jgi:hypothetical protein